MTRLKEVSGAKAIVGSGSDREASPRGIKAWVGIFTRGLAMGVAEAVPGVSGGTIAFVTGIYDELLRTLSRFGPASVALLIRSGPLAFWRQHNLNFLLVLSLGMGTALLVFARILGLLLDTVAPVVWAFFLGLIAASVAQIGRARALRRLVLWGLPGVLLGLGLLVLDPADAGAHALVFLLGGVAAISAWLLPAISGSFVLLVLGLYEPVLRSLNTLDFSVLAPFVIGCALGIMTMARVLAWLMQRWREQTLALLTGFMAGSMVTLWPWRVGGVLLTPSGYAAQGAGDPLVGFSIAAALAGMVVLWLISRLEQ
jgi:putative membrane protein